MITSFYTHENQTIKLWSIEHMERVENEIHFRIAFIPDPIVFLYENEPIARAAFHEILGLINP